MLQNQHAAGRRKVLSNIPSFKVEVYARLHQMNPSNPLAEWCVPTEFGVMTLMVSHNLSFPNDQVQYINVGGRNQHFAILYFDLENKLIQYADSVHKFA
ncbi:unnamed protein product [Caenorhabditis brenneri]